MELAAKAVAAGICAALMALLLKKSNAELSVCLGLAAAAAILMAVLGLADELAADIVSAKSDYAAEQKAAAEQAAAYDAILARKKA